MQRKLILAYLLLPLILWLLQALYTFNFLNSLGGDEIYTIRDVLPFQHRALAGPGASSTSFYATLLGLYHLFGFDLHMAKFLRLGLQLISLFCLSLLLKKYLTVKIAFFPMLVIGLSPALLYWNTTGAAWGIDLQFLPIVLYLISLGGVWAMGGWFVSMVAWMAYPNFIFYLPFLVYLNCLSSLRRLRYFILSLVAFILPLLSLYLYIGNKDTLFYDTQLQRGLFTGGGELIFSEELFFKSTAAVFINLFDKATSYMFQVNMVDFSHILPIIAFLLVIFIPLKFLNADKKIKPLIYCCLGIALSNLILTGFMLDGSGLPGGRRNTPFLAGIYGLFVITWYLIISKNILSQKYKFISSSILFILLIHHLIAYPVNLYTLQNLNYTAVPWFSQEKTPQQSLDKMLSVLTQQNLVLDCEKQLGLSHPVCYYSSVYAILTQACYYQKLNCHHIQARFPYEKDYQTLDYNLFAKEYWDK